MYSHTIIEADEIYYNEYYKASGADKIDDKYLRYIHFDSAINHGVGRANKFYEQSGGNFDKYFLTRNDFYNSLLKDSTQKKFYKGWINRINNIQKMKDDNYFSN